MSVKYQLEQYRKTVFRVQAIEEMILRLESRIEAAKTMPWSAEHTGGRRTADACQLEEVLQSLAVLKEAWARAAGEHYSSGMWIAEACSQLKCGNQTAVIIFYYGLGKPFKEIAAIMGKDVRTVRDTHNKALKSLAQKP